MSYTIACGITGGKVYTLNSDDFTTVSLLGSTFGSAVSTPSVAFSPDGKYLAVAAFSAPFLRVYDRNNSLTPITIASNLSSAGYSLAFSPDSTRLVVGSVNEPTLAVYDCATWQKDTISEDVSYYIAYRVRSISFAQDSQSFIAGGSDYDGYHAQKVSKTGANYWDAGYQMSPNGAVNGVAHSSDGLFVALAYASSPFSSLYSASSLGTPISGFPSAFSSCNCVAISPSGTMIAFGHTASPYYRIIKNISGTWYNLSSFFTIPAAPGIVYSLEFSLDNSLLFIGHANSPYLSIFNIDTAALVPGPTTLTGTCFSVRRAPNDAVQIDVSGTFLCSSFGGVGVLSATVQALSEVIGDFSATSPASYALLSAKTNALVLLYDTLPVGDQFSAQPTFGIHDRWAIDDNIDARLSVRILLDDSAKLIDRYRAIWALVLATEIDLTADMTSAIAAVITGAEILASLEALATGFTTSTTFAEMPALDSTATTRAQIIADSSVNASMADTTQMPAMQLIGGVESSHWADTVLGPVTISTTFDEAPAFQGQVNARARIRAAQPDVGVALTDVAQAVGRPLIGGTERFVSTDIAAVVADFRLALLEGLIASDVFHRVAELSESELVDIATALSNAARAELAATETVALTDALRHSAVFLMSDASALADSAGLTFSTLLDLADGSAFIVSLPLAEGDFSAWVMNADTTGVTTYANFPMLGLASFEGVPYGLTETGLYRLEGDDDAGTDIDASLATGDMDFGTSRDKNVPRAYLYITQPGDVILKTISQIRGARHETYYELAARTTDGDDETLRRVPLGRGVRGVWWRFELHNVKGSDFELDGAEVRPVVLSRRG